LTHHGKTPFKLYLPFLYTVCIMLARVIWATARLALTPSLYHLNGNGQLFNEWHLAFVHGLT
jgi:hypothetical protein